jgi:hypothetical protein
MLGEQDSQGTIRLGRMRLARTLIQAGTLDQDRAEDRPDLRRVRSFTVLPAAAVGTRTLRLQVRRQLLLHDDLLQGFEEGFTLVVITT